MTEEVKRCLEISPPSDLRQGVINQINVKTALPKEENKKEKRGIDSKGWRWWHWYNRLHRVMMALFELIYL